LLKTSIKNLDQRFSGGHIECNKESIIVLEGKFK
jgi:hypothetical protein